MKKYITPEMEIDEFKVEDIITTSGGGDAPIPGDQGDGGNVIWDD